MRRHETLAAGLLESYRDGTPTGLNGPIRPTGDCLRHQRTNVQRMITHLSAMLMMMLAGKTVTALEVDFADYRDAEGVIVRKDGDRINVGWKIADGEAGRLVLDLRPGEPLIEILGIAPGLDGEATAILKGVDPATFVTVGTRVGDGRSAAGDEPVQHVLRRPGEASAPDYQARLDPKRARVTGGGRAGRRSSSASSPRAVRGDAPDSPSTQGRGWSTSRPS